MPPGAPYDSSMTEWEQTPLPKIPFPIEGRDFKNKSHFSPFDLGKKTREKKPIAVFLRFDPPKGTPTGGGIKHLSR